jgi:hypothetical protein
MRYRIRITPHDPGSTASTGAPFPLDAAVRKRRGPAPRQERNAAPQAIGMSSTSGSPPRPGSSRSIT